jgi:hypothetical protein
MIYQDEQQEKADRTAFLAAVGQFISRALPTAQAAPEMTPMLLEMLKFGVTAFKAGKQLEGIIDQTADDLKKQYEATKGQPKPPSPEAQKMQMTMQIEQAKMQAKQSELQMQGQLEQQKLQAQIELERAKQEFQAQENQLKFQLEEQRNQLDREMEMRSNQMKTEMEMKVAQMKMMTERNTQVLLAHINNGAKIETARISAGVDDGQEAYTSEEDMAQAMEHPLQPIANAIGQGNQQMAQAISALVDTINQQHNRPKTVVRDENGKIVGVH